MSDWDEEEDTPHVSQVAPAPTRQNYNSSVYRNSAIRNRNRELNTNSSGNWREHGNQPRAGVSTNNSYNSRHEGHSRSDGSHVRQERGNPRQERNYAPRQGGSYSRREGNNARQEGNNKSLNVPSQKVGRIIGKGGSKIRDLEFESDTKIKIGKPSGDETEITLYGTDDAIVKVSSMIDELLIDYFPKKEPKPDFEQTQDNAQENNTQDKINNPGFVYKVRDEDGIELIDWNKLHEETRRLEEEKFKKLPPLVKDFYVEHPEVSSMSPAEVAQWRRNNNDIQVSTGGKPATRPFPNPVLTFEHAFKNYPGILEEIYKQEFTQPSPIQSQAWPILMRGDDMIGIAQTGTGKTLAFILPALIHIENQPIPRHERKGPTVLVMAPTRELSIQIYKEVSKYQYKGFKAVVIYGGASRKEQIKQCADGVDIAIATPGRLNDFIMNKYVNPLYISYVVLDEADRMLDMGFGPQIRMCLSDIRPDRQTVMTSATWPSDVRRLADQYMKDPIHVNVGSLDLAAVHTVTQKILFVNEEEKDDALFEFVQNMDSNDKIIIFCGKKATAQHISTELCLKGIECQSLHGNRDQIDRENALEEMVDGTVNILVATDVASRGIDIKDLTHVVNLDFPRHIEEYVHRVGRTGRAGKTGIALSFISRKDWAHARDLIKILQEANQEVPQELEDMAQRFEAWKLKKDQTGDGGARWMRNGGGDRRGRW